MFTAQDIDEYHQRIFTECLARRVGTQTEFAEAIGCSFRSLHHYINGRSIPQHVVINAVAHVGGAITYLLTVPRMVGDFITTDTTLALVQPVPVIDTTDIFEGAS